MSHIGLSNNYLNTFFGLIGLYRLFVSSKSELFFSGFFIGIFWFYWVGISYQYYDLAYLSPLFVLGFGLGYGIIFLVVDVFNNIYIRVILLFSLNYFYPFNFNWFNFNLIFVDSIFDVTSSEKNLAFIFLLVFLLTQSTLKKARVLILFHFLFVIDFRALYPYQDMNSSVEQLKSKISFANYSVEQSQKWEKSYQQTIINKNFESINQAIKDKKELIILPETAFPIYIKNHSEIFDNLLKLSQQITIITGSLDYDKATQNIYNATFFFDRGEYKIAHKVVLVPFGEEVPLPKVLRDMINDIFYNGAKDYAKADNPTDFKLGIYNLRNAICYEATSEVIYQNLKANSIVIAMSNNAWFTPSIEPTLQKIFLKYYSKKYKITIIHSINGSESYVLY
jgi:apolipoprotein N-acyltransferase